MSHRATVKTYCWGWSSRHETLAELNGRQWEELLPRARAARLLARLAAEADTRGSMDSLPPEGRAHLSAAAALAAHHELKVAALMSVAIGHLHDDRSALARTALGGCRASGGGR